MNLPRSTKRLVGFCPALVCLVVTQAVGAPPTEKEGSGGVSPFGRGSMQYGPPAFVENLGQWDTAARFVARRGPMVARFETDAIVLQLEDREAQDQGRGLVVRLAFEGARDDVTLHGTDPRSGVYNFFLGRDRSRWRTQVPAYGKVMWRGLYDGVDLRVRHAAGHLEYDLMLSPGADLTQVVIRSEGIDRLEIAPDGKLVMHTILGPIYQSPPTTWHRLPSGERQMVECRFCLIDDNRYGFEVPRLDSSLPLVIDPGLEWCTFLGGTGNEVAAAVVVDELGIVTVCGWTTSLNFPITPGVYDPTYNGSGPGGWGDIFVARLDPSRSGTDQLVWSTYLGGSSDENANGVALDSDGTVVIGGWTSSSDFPTTLGAYDESFNGVDDVVAARLSATGDQLLWSTLLGGSDSDYAGAFRTMALDESGMVTLTGYTASDNFPTTSGAFDETYNGSGPEGWGDGFVARFDPSQKIPGDQLVYATYLGGSGDEGGSGIAVDSAGVVTIEGTTSSDDLPVTGGCYDPTFNGGSAEYPWDAFVARLVLTGNGSSDLTYLTYLGGSSGEAGNCLVIDGAGVVTVTGSVASLDFPTTPGAFDETFNGPDWDAFVSRLSLDGAGAADLVYSTFLGGAGDHDYGYNLALDDGGVNVVGVTSSSDFPVRRAQDDSWNGLQDTFVSRLQLPLGKGDADLDYSTYLGGPSWDTPRGVTADYAHTLVVVGRTNSGNFPTTPDAYDTTHNGLRDAFVARFDMCPWDLNGDGMVSTADLLDLLSQWGSDPGGPPDFDGDGNVGTSDLLKLLGNWGDCP